MLSAFMRVRVDRSSMREVSDPEIIRTDYVIGRADLPLRRILIRHYCTRGHVREKAARIGLPKSTYYDKLEEARWWVHTEYDKVVALPDGMRYGYASVGVVTAHNP